MSDSFLKRSGMTRVNEGSDSFTCHYTRAATSGMNHTCLYSQPQSVTALWPVRYSFPADGRRLSWPGWLFTYGRGLPSKDGHPSQC